MSENYNRYVLGTGMIDRNKTFAKLNPQANTIFQMATSFRQARSELRFFDESNETNLFLIGITNSTKFTKLINPHMSKLN